MRMRAFSTVMRYRRPLSRRLMSGSWPVPFRISSYVSRTSRGRGVVRSCNLMTASFVVAKGSVRSGAGEDGPNLVLGELAGVGALPVGDDLRVLIGVLVQGLGAVRAVRVVLVTVEPAGEPGDAPGADGEVRERGLHPPVEVGEEQPLLLLGRLRVCGLLRLVQFPQLRDRAHPGVLDGNREAGHGADTGRNVFDGGRHVGG